MKPNRIDVNSAPRASNPPQNARAGLADGLSEPVRFKQGDFDITVLSDGFISLPTDLVIPNRMAPARAEILRRLGAASGAIEVATNIPLIRSGNDTILVDIGAGAKYQPSDGKLATHLAAAHIDPASVTKVVFTHAHPDHIWGALKDDGTLSFPSATYYVGAAEWNFWMDPDYLTSMPDVLHDFARAAQRDLGAIRERVVLLKPEDDVVTGMRAISTPGHTPGHLSFELDGGDGLIITADATTNQIISFEHPDWRFGYDALPEIAIETRIRLVDRATADRVRLLGYHWSYPGVGFVERSHGKSRFIAADLLG